MTPNETGGAPCDAPLVMRLCGAGLDPAIVGAKAAALDRVIARGHRVPTACAITTEAYRRCRESAAIGILIDRLRQRGPGGVDDAEIDRAHIAAPPPGLADALATIGDDLPDRSCRRWAVRSSATAEDLDDASFAGQYTSLLNVATDEIDRAITLVWSSLWHDAPRRYRWFHGLDDDEIGMGVLVMEMLRPDHAGVLFTADPMGDGATMRIEVVRGLGESLVSGTATPEVIRVDRDTRRPDTNRFPFVDELIDVGLDLEQLFGRPQDIEWAIADGDLYVLQSRAITTADHGTSVDDGFDDPLDDSLDGRRCYTTAGISEMLPGPLSPRLWSLNRPLIDDGFRRLFATLGADAAELADDTDLFVRVRGRAALDADLLRSITGSIPGASVAEVDEQYFGVDSTEGDNAGQRTSTPLRQGARILRARAAAALESEIAIQIVDALLETEPDLRELATDELLTRRSRLTHVAGRVMAAEVAVAAIATASFRTVERFLARYLDPDRAPAAARTLTTDPSQAGETVLSSIAELAEQLEADELAAILEIDEIDEAADWPASEAVLARTDSGRRALAAFSHRLARAGSMSVFGGRTWAESPEAGWALWRGLRHRQGGGGRNAAATAAIEEEVAGAPTWRQHRALHGHLADVRVHFLRRESNEAAVLLARRESTKAALFRLGGIIRRLDVELGRRFTADGLLADADDIDLVAGHEMRAVADGHGPSPAQLNTRRRRGTSAEQLGPLPNRFDGVPDEQPVPAVEGAVLEAWGASPGHFRGRARVVDDPHDHRLHRGDVLIAANTDASWMPLFLTAGAIVVEAGGPLSHAAIVARELGVPAVVNAQGIVARIRAAAVPPTVSVDGTAGAITIDEDAPTGAVATITEVVPPRDPPAITRIGEPRVGVFVTGLIGAGALMSAVFAATEAIGGRRARRRYDRRARPVAAGTAHLVEHGVDDAARSSLGLWPRRDYAWVAAALALVAGFVAAESTEAYVESGTGSATLIWALALTTACSLGGAAFLAGVAAWRWPAVPPSVRSLTRTGIAPVHDPGHRSAHQAWIATALAVGFALLLAANIWIPGLVGDIDRWLQDALQASAETDRIGPTWLRVFGQPWFVIPLAVALGLASYRCRVLAFGLPALIVGAGLTNVMLWWVVGKERPDEGIHAGRSDSFPGGHAITVTLLFGLLPLAVHVIGRRRLVTAIARVASTAVMAVLLVDQIRQGGHWPTDQLAGLLLGACGVIALHGLVAAESAHYRCSSCPWSEPQRSGPAEDR